MELDLHHAQQGARLFFARVAAMDEADRAQIHRIAESFAPRDPSVAEVCIDCNGQIEPERLNALKSTARCAHCAHQLELIFRRGRPS